MAIYNLSQVVMKSYNYTECSFLGLSIIILQDTNCSLLAKQYYVYYDQIRVGIVSLPIYL